jgi:hypothetical protein
MTSPENEESTKQQDKTLQELSPIWRELLGALPPEAEHPESEALAIPLPDDPWSELLHAEGIKVIDLQQAQIQAKQVRLSEKDVEQALQVMREEQEL